MTSFLKWLSGRRPDDPLGDKFADYLIQWRLGLWIGIRHKELLIWSFLAFYGAAIGVTFGVGRQYISPLTEFVIVALLSFLGVHVVLDANLRNTRNLFIISRIGKFFLRNKPGVFLPQDWHERPLFQFDPIYRIHVQMITLLALLSYLRYIWHYVMPPCCAIQQTAQLVGLVTATIIALALFWLLDKSGEHYRYLYFSRFREKIEKDVDDALLPQPTESEKQQAALRDPSWIAAALGRSLTSTLFIVSLLMNLKFPPWAALISVLLSVGIVSYSAYQLRSWWTHFDTPFDPSFAATLRNRVQCANRVLLSVSAVLLAIYVVVNRQMLLCTWFLISS